MTDEKVTDIVGLGKAAAQLIQTGEKFLERLIGPFLDEKGQQWAEGAKRRYNLAQVANQAEVMLGGTNPTSVPGRILFPLLNYAANEEEPNLQKRWAALLASASHPTSKTPVHVGFVHLLSNLSPRDVRFLGFFKDHLTDNALTVLPFESQSVRDALDFSDDDVDLILSNLERLGIVEFAQQASIVDVNVYDGIAKNAPVEYTAKFHFTTYGIAFVRACQPPDLTT